MFTRKMLNDNAHLITESAFAFACENWEYMSKPMKFFGSSVKLEKGKDKRDSYIMYLQPAGKVSRKTLCDGAAMSGCEAACLIQSGQLGMSVGQRAATKRTILMICDPVGFKNSISAEIVKAERKAQKTGIPALFRLNGTSDVDFSDIISESPLSEFYDYTKVLSRIRQNTLPNYHITFSGSMYTKQSRNALVKAVARKYNIAVAFNTKGLIIDDVIIPSVMVDFDETDLRPMDKPQSIGALKRKGSSIKSRKLEGKNSFFVTSANYNDAMDILFGS